MTTDKLTRELAEYFYRHLRLEPAEIALRLELPPSTIYRWMREHHWQPTRLATNLSPNAMAERLMDHIYRIEKQARDDDRPLSLEETRQIKMLRELVESMTRKSAWFAHVLEGLEQFSNDLKASAPDLHEKVRPHLIAFARKLLEQQPV